MTVSGPACGSASLNAKLPDGSFLLDRAGYGLTALLFSEAAPDAGQAALLDQLRALDSRVVALVIRRGGTAPGSIDDSNGDIARLFNAGPGTLYLLRPDLHIAARWKALAPGEVVAQLKAGLGWSAP